MARERPERRRSDTELLPHEVVDKFEFRMKNNEVASLVRITESGGTDLKSGEAVVFQDGLAIPGTWSKPDAFSRTRFFDGDGLEIAFNRGQTWIEVLSFADPLIY